VNASLSLADVNIKGLHEMHPPGRTFIQFACDANQTVSNVLETDRNSLFTKHLLNNIKKENVDVTEIFRHIADAVYRESNAKQKPFSMNGLLRHEQVYLNEVIVDRTGKFGPGRVKLKHTVFHVCR
jgi:hypothetical protein